MKIYTHGYVPKPDNAQSICVASKNSQYITLVYVIANIVMPKKCISSRCLSFNW